MLLLDIPITKPVRTAEPTLQQEPVTLAEARRQCGVGEWIDYHDETFKTLIPAARAMVENDTGIVCYTGSFTQKWTEWGSDVIELADLRPITSITSIAYLDTDGASQTLATTVYQLETGNVKQFIRLKYNQSWPSLRGDINGITITYVAGYASVQAIPPMVKQAVLLAILVAWNEANGEVNSQGIQSVDATRLAYERVVNILSRRTYP